MPWWLTGPLLWHWLTCDSNDSNTRPKKSSTNISQRWFDKLYQESLPGIKICLQQAEDEPEWKIWAQDYTDGYVIKKSVKKALDNNLVLLEKWEKELGESHPKTKRAQARRSATFAVYYAVLCDQWSDDLLDVIRVCVKNATQDMKEAQAAS